MGNNQSDANRRFCRHTQANEPADDRPDRSADRHRAVADLFLLTPPVATNREHIAGTSIGRRPYVLSRGAAILEDQGDQGAANLMNPLISDGAINASKHGDFEQHSAEAFDQMPQAGFWHVWYKFVEHGSLTKQRMRALF